LEEIKIGDKHISSYITACLRSLNDNDGVKMLSRGNNIKTALDVLEILKREYVKDPKYDIEVGSEKFNERYVTTVTVILKGKRLEGK